MSNPLNAGVPVLFENREAKLGNYLGVQNFYPIISEVSITSAQVKAMRATPIQLAVAPGAGLFCDLEQCVLMLKYGNTNPFTGAQNFVVRYVGTAGVIVSQTITGAGFIDQSGNMRTSAAQKVDEIATQAQFENQGLFLHNSGAAEITGNAANDNILIVRTSYNIYPTGFLTGQ